MSGDTVSDRPDASELRRLEAELEECRQRLHSAERLLAAVFQHAPFPIAVIEMLPDGTSAPVALNPATSRMFGMPEDAPLPPQGEGAIPAETMAGIQARLRASLRAGTTQAFEEELVMPHRTIWTEALYTPIPGGDPARPWVTIASFDISERKLREQEELAERQAIIEQQALSLNEISTPLLAISDGVVVLPLIGTIDTRRAQMVIETLLSGITESRASTAIIDITGVSVVDTQVANAILRAAQAARLLGADVVLTGIRPEIAQVMISLGIDLGAIVTRSTLQAGIAYSLQGR